MFGWRYCGYTSFVCMSWKTTCSPTCSLSWKTTSMHESVYVMKTWAQQVMKNTWHAACKSWTRCHATHVMKPWSWKHMSWKDMIMHDNKHHEQHMSWTPHKFQVLWFYHGIASAHNAKKPTQPQVPVLVLTQKAAKSFWAHMQKLQICFPVLCSTVAMSSVASFACGIWTLTSWSGQSKFHPSMCWSKAGSGSFHTHISSVLANETLVAHWRANMCRNLCTSAKRR